MTRMEIIDRAIAATPKGVRGPTLDPIERLGDNPELLARMGKREVISSDDPEALANPVNWRKYLAYVEAQRATREDGEEGLPQTRKKPRKKPHR